MGCDYKLKRYEETPVFLQMKYITSGYRVLWPAEACARSVWMWHNQTANIHTHLWAFVWFGYLAYTHATTSEGGEMWAGLVFYLSVVAAFLGSTVFHTFNSVSEASYRRCNQLDVNGIVSSIVGAYVPIAYHALACHPEWRTLHFTLFSAVALAVGGASQLTIMTDPSFIVGRILTMGLLVATLVGSSLHIAILGADSPGVTAFVRSILAATAYLIVGAVLYALRFPERCAPHGMFDTLFNSHNWLHVFSVLAMYQHACGIRDIQEYNKIHPCL